MKIKKNRLWEVFEQLSRRDLRELGDWVQSPSLNKREYVVKLFDFLVECVMELKLIPDKKLMYSKAFPGLEYDDSRIRSAMSLLLKVIERYLALNEIDENPAEVSLALAKAYRKKNLQKHYQQTIRTVEESLSKEMHYHADFHTRIYDLEYEKYRSLSAQRQLNAINLQLVSDKLDIGYLSQKLRQTCFSISHTRVYSTEYDFGLLPSILEKAQEEQYQSIPAISLYYHGYYALTDPSDERHFKKFKAQLFEFGNQFPKNELRDLYLLVPKKGLKPRTSVR